MNQVFNLSRWSGFAVRQLYLNLNTKSLKIAIAAIACASLVQAEQLDYASLLELLLNGITNDSVSINECLAK
ncbi:hypothetical protein [Pontibacter harenae]|uniref:hypothetical protein n=1 Tax=Pontibacter harenae TaxID=2894083 RepID=UPI001E4DDB2D|nr:hypothetical protein [Pontibacter harenae]MCC9168045.1 hypothetical protein [Pontibacter harenae]